MENYNIISENSVATVMAKYTPEPRTEKGYQTEAELEREFIQNLQAQQYEYADIRTEKDLIENLRHKLELLNGITFSDNEWRSLFRNQIANPTLGVEEKTELLQRRGKHILQITRDNGTTKNIYLIDKGNIHNNSLQVINQYVPESETKNRYDVTILVNGLPLVHIELKKRGVAIREAFNQIRRYGHESFCQGSGLFEYVQIFVISNGTSTKYYSNTTRKSHLYDQSRQRFTANRKSTSNSFDFTNYWADASNEPILDLIDFTKTFFCKHTILNILTRYCVFNVNNCLMVMRPYQIVATENIIYRINRAYLNNLQGTVKAGGYIWHTTGSGKTLTSFKTAQLAMELPYIDKVLFVVDRQDLDYQTMLEYNRFEKDSVNGNTNTEILRRQLENEGKFTTENVKIIVTTIQKLSILVNKRKELKAYDQNIVLIFDECHRSQFGKMHEAIIRKFRKYYIFGFTGTPIFTKNSNSNALPTLRTTDQAFGDRLHTYTIINAINDHNVLPFKIDYVKTIDIKEIVEAERVYDINRQEILLDRRRIYNIVKYIYENFDHKTKRNGKIYDYKERRISGFNSIFATSGIPAAIKYYEEFSRYQGLNKRERLKVALIYSFKSADNDDYSEFMDEEDTCTTSGLSNYQREFLNNAIQDYNVTFGTSFDTSAEKFPNYYKDVSERMKNKEIDILIVANMFLTGFDAPTLNTLWVDKNLRLHGLLQAFSRTNRILNSIKNCGNIVCFRDLDNATNEALALFADVDAKGVVLLKTFSEYYLGYDDSKGIHHKGFCEILDELSAKYPITRRPRSINQKKEFVDLFGSYLKTQNIIRVFDEYLDDGKCQKLSERDEQDYRSIYNDIHDEMRPLRPEQETVNDDIVFEMELMKSVEVSVDYILMLIRKFHASNCKNKKIVGEIRRAINSSPDLRDKKELIEKFVNNMTSEITDIDREWQQYLTNERDLELKKIIMELRLKPLETEKFIRLSFHYGYIDDEGTEFSDILPPISRFSPMGELSSIRRNALDRLTAFFNRFHGVIGYQEEDIFVQSIAAEKGDDFE